MTSAKPLRRTGALCACLSVALLAAAPTVARAATVWSVRGAGFGHGVGMSQFGAYGYAKHGADYRQILSHYYSGTSIGDAQSRTIRVLLRAGASRVSFSGGRRACGRTLKPESAYTVTRKGSDLVLRSRSGRALATCAAPFRATGSGGITVARMGRYRGALEVRPALFGGMNVINAVALESYVKGVVTNESPSSWPTEALKAQAVAARSYALATKVTGLGFDQFSDTRSQVYRGYSSETKSGNQAVDATAHQVVTYGGDVAVTYFFSTSGGQTEDVELSFLGSAAKPWLKSVDDPYDDSSPYHRWGPFHWSRATFQRELGRLVDGTFRGIKVLERGKSPRIVYANVIGSEGTQRVTGATLRARLGLRDTWAYFTRITSGEQTPTSEPPTETPTTTTPDTGSGGTEPSGSVPAPSGGAGPPGQAATAPALPWLAGSISPAPETGSVEIQRLQRGRWVTVKIVRLDGNGAFSVPVPRGIYRIRSGLDIGPTVRIG